jgi:hypothetical protein
MPDDEKTPTSLFDHVVVRGVRLESRYRKQDEFDLLAQVVRDMPYETTLGIEKIYCNTKYGSDYVITMREESNLWSATEKAEAFRASLLKFADGFNDISVANTKVSIDTYWKSDEDTPA